MRSRLLRALLTLATLVVVWLVASPARADVLGGDRAAPICDPRGAIGFAPPPQIQDLEVTLDVVLNDGCTSSQDDLLRAVPQRAPHADAAPTQEPALTSVVSPAPDPSSSARVLAPRATDVRLPAGVKRAVDRPPRA